MGGASAGRLTLQRQLVPLQARIAELEAERAAHPCGCLACMRERQAVLDAVYAIDDRAIGIRRKGGRET